MDPLTLTTGIAGLLGLSIQIAEKITNYINGVKNCSKSIKDLSEKLKLLEQVLKQLEDFLCSEKMKGSAFYETSSLYSTTTNCSEKLMLLSRKLEKQTKKNKTIRNLEWPLTEDVNLQTIRILDQYIRAFQFSLTIEGCTLLSNTADAVSRTLTIQLETVNKVAKMEKIFPKISTLIEIAAETSANISSILMAVNEISDSSDTGRKICRGLEEMRQTSKRKEILEWLSPLTYQKRHNDICSLREPGTGKWFLQTDEFKEWSSGDKNPILWCPGIAGAGKTVMTSSIIEYLVEAYPKESTGIAYLYCDYKDTTVQTSLNLFSSITRQLSAALPSIPSEIEEFYKKEGVYTVISHIDLLISLSRRFTRTFLLVDALDEMQSDDGYNDWKVLLAKVKKAQAPIQILVTSRYHESIEHIFNESPRLDIQANIEDVRTYAKSRITSNLYLASLTTNDPGLRESIITTISERVGKMFLLARFQLDHLASQTNARHARNALNTMPEKLADIYDETILRIKAQSKERAELALKLLSWIYYAQRPLRIDELRHALAVEQGDNRFDKSGLHSVELLLGVCCGLVSVDENGATIALVHFTIKEHFDKNCGRLFVNGQIEIARTCLTYLTFVEYALDLNTNESLLSKLDVPMNPTKSSPNPRWKCHIPTAGVSIIYFGLPRCPKKRLVESNRHHKINPFRIFITAEYELEYPFLTYAAKFWFRHLRGEPESELQGLFLDFVTSKGKQISSINSQDNCPSPLEFAICAGLETIVRNLVDKGEEIDPSLSLRSPLFLAAESRDSQEHDKICKFLFDRGASTFIVGPYGNDSFEFSTYAASGRSRDNTKALLKMLGLELHHKWPTIHSSARQHPTLLLHPFALKEKVKGGSRAIKQLFLDQGWDKSGEIPLWKLPVTAKSITNGNILLDLPAGLQIKLIPQKSFRYKLGIYGEIEFMGLFQKFTDISNNTRQGKRISDSVGHQLGGEVSDLVGHQISEQAASPPPANISHTSSNLSFPKTINTLIILGFSFIIILLLSFLIRHS